MQKHFLLLEERQTYTWGGEKGKVKHTAYIWSLGAPKMENKQTSAIHAREEVGSHAAELAGILLVISV